MQLQRLVARCVRLATTGSAVGKLCQYARKVHYKVEYTPKTAVKQSFAAYIYMCIFHNYRLLS